jgi:hypothetical protein
MSRVKLVCRNILEKLPMMTVKDDASRASYVTNRKENEPIGDMAEDS